MKRNLTMSWMAVLMITLLTACGGGGGSGEGGVVYVINAEAGQNRYVSTESRVVLDGSESSGNPGAELTFRWSITNPDGSNAELSNRDIVNPSFTPNIDGTYTLTLEVFSGGSETPDTTELKVLASSENSQPVVNAGGDMTININVGSVVINGASSFDADGDDVTHQWTVINQPQGNQANFDNDNALTPTFNFAVNGIYEIRLVGNDGEKNSEPDIIKITVGEANSIPLANAAADQYTTTGTAIPLDGSNSDDADGDRLTHRWFLTAKPPGSTLTILTDETTVSPIFTPDIIGTYMIGLIVNDGQIDSAIDSMLVIVTEGNNAPIANAGLKKTVDVSTIVTLNGINSYDDDGDMLSYTWTLTRPTGSNASLDDSATKKPSFAADKVGDYQASLSVSDGNSDSEIDTVIITVIQPNRQPIANAGADQNKQVDDTVTLDGSASSDEDSDNLTFSWSLTRPGGSTASLTNVDTKTPTFIADVAGTYTAQLIVKDGTVDSDADMVVVVVTATPPSNNKPVANAGNNQEVFVGQSVNLSGADSTDADNQDLFYIWELTTKPEGSQATLTVTDAETTSFTPDIIGDYEVTLVVNDGVNNSNPVTITIKANLNTSPTATIIAPTDGGEFDASQVITFEGTATDVEDGDLTGDALVWTSSKVETALCTGNSCEAQLFPGDHTITLTATDSMGAPGVSSSIIVKVTGNRSPTIVMVDSLQKGLVAYYPFNGNANDDSGNGNDGIVNGATLTEDRNGNADSAYSFDGASYISADASNMPSGERTVSFWFKAQTVENHPVLFSYGGGECGTSLFMGVNAKPSAYAGSYYVSSHCGANDLIYVYSDDPSGNWVLLTMTTSQSGTSIYINDKLVATNTNFIANTVVDSTDLSIGVATSSSGKTPYVDSNVDYFIGDIDSVRVFDRELGKDEIEYAYRGRPSNYTANQTITLCVNANDDEDGVVFGDSISWQSDVDGDLGTGECITTKFSAGDHKITITATDSLSDSSSIEHIVHINALPVATIVTPVNKAEFTSGATIDFSGSAIDDEDGALTGELLVWTSSIDGEIGKSETFSKVLSDGQHIITLSATDQDGASNTSAVTVCIPDCGIFSEDFELGLGVWSITNGTWEVGGVPVEFGPGRCYSSVNCAGTVLAGSYISTDSGILSPSIRLPDLTEDQELHLRFWHWFSLDANDVARVYVREQISPGVWSDNAQLHTFTRSSGSVWTQPLIDLSAYAGKKVQVQFFLDYGGGGVGAGWYVDDVTINVVDSLPSSALYSEDYTNGLGEWWASNGTWEVGEVPEGVGPGVCNSETTCAGTVLAGSYTSTDSGLLSPSIRLPDLTGDQELHLRFWHWFSLDANDVARVYVREQISPGVWSDNAQLHTFTRSSGSVWTQPLIDLSAYAGKKVQVQFFLDYGGGGVGAGWYIDNVSVDVVDNLPNFVPYTEDYIDGLGEWWASNGTWEVGEVPGDVGPGACNSETTCAGTVLAGSYTSTDSGLLSPSIRLPDLTGDQELHLRFWHWFSLDANDVARVYVREQISPGVWSDNAQLHTFTRSSGSVWTQPLIDLSAYVGKKVQVQFFLDYGGGGVDAGWYVDDISIEVSTP